MEFAPKMHAPTFFSKVHENFLKNVPNHHTIFIKKIQIFALSDFSDSISRYPEEIWKFQFYRSKGIAKVAYKYQRNILIFLLVPYVRKKIEFPRKTLDDYAGKVLTFGGCNGILIRKHTPKGSCSKQRGC